MSALIVGALALTAVGPASAHSLLLGSSPAAGAVGAAPARVRLTFNNRIEKALSRVRLVDERGGERVLDIRTLDGHADTLAASLPSLPPGPYRVDWQVLSIDGHLVRGSFSFRVLP